MASHNMLLLPLLLLLQLCTWLPSWQQLQLPTAAVAAAAAPTPRPTLPKPPARLAHFAWFHDVIADTNPFASFTFGTPDRPAGSGAGALPTNASWLVHAHAAFGVDGMWDAQSTFFGPSSARNGHLALRPDWRVRWAAVSEAAAPLLANGTMFGFFLGDELHAQKVTTAELRIAADAVRGTFPSPSVITWVNFCACPPFGNWTGKKWAPGAGFAIPPSISWASIDVYDGLRQSIWPSTPFVPRVQAAVGQLLLPRMLPNQSLMLVPGSYTTALPSQKEWCNRTCGDAKSARDAEDFYAWALRDERIVGMAVWNWGGCGLCAAAKDEIGTVDLVESKAAWMAIGKAIARKNDDADDDADGGDASVRVVIDGKSIECLFERTVNAYGTQTKTTTNASLWYPATSNGEHHWNLAYARSGEKTAQGGRCVTEVTSAFSGDGTFSAELCVHPSHQGWPSGSQHV